MKIFDDTRFWINIVSLDHVRKSVAGGFLQSSRGEKEGLDVVSRGDYVLFYSPRTQFRQGKPLQQFTALGMVQDGEPYRVTSGTSNSWQYHMEFSDAEPTLLEPLVSDLAFIPDKEKWGLPYNKGLFQIERDDFVRIVQAMGVSESTQGVDQV
jgi:EVE domain-containing protein